MSTILKHRNSSEGLKPVETCFLWASWLSFCCRAKSAVWGICAEEWVNLVDETQSSYCHTWGHGLRWLPLLLPEGKWRHVGDLLVLLSSIGGLISGPHIWKHRVLERQKFSTWVELDQIESEGIGKIGIGGIRRQESSKKRGWGCQGDSRWQFWLRPGSGGYRVPQAFAEVLMPSLRQLFTQAVVWVESGSELTYKCLCLYPLSFCRSHFWKIPDTSII